MNIQNICLCLFFSVHIHIYIYIYIIYIYIYNVKSGLINPSRLINHHCPFFLKFKNRWSPQINKHFGLLPIKKPPVLKSIFFIQKFQMVSLWFPYGFLMIYIYIFKLKPHEHQNPSLLIIEHLKKQLFPK